MTNVDVVIIGGGPAGASLGRLLARRGHSVLLLSRGIDVARGLAESLPPSSRKLLAVVGVLDAVEGGGFLPTTGNTVWWGDRAGEVEEFAAADEVRGYQVFRPVFDRLLLQCAADAGVIVADSAVVSRVRFTDDEAVVEYEVGGERRQATAAFAIDCSGRAGVIARQRWRQYDQRFRMQAFVGAWRRGSAWPIADESHTLVETYEDGWAWSVPVAAGVRHIVTMVDGGTTTINRGPTLQHTYSSELQKTKELALLSRGAELTGVFACDASLYTSTAFSGPNFMLVGDAASTIDPLSSFGVKKALASAWLASVAIGTALTHPGRRSLALELFARRERQMYASYFERSCDYAREAAARHPSPFWSARADARLPLAQRDNSQHDGIDRQRLHAAFEQLKASSSLDVQVSERAALIPYGVVRGEQVEAEDAFVVEATGEPLRFVAGVDAVALARIAAQSRDVGQLYSTYVTRHGARALPEILTALSVLVAHRILISRVQTSLSAS